MGVDDKEMEYEEEVNVELQEPASYYYSSNRSKPTNFRFQNRGALGWIEVAIRVVAIIVILGTFLKFDFLGGYYPITYLLQLVTFLVLFAASVAFCVPKVLEKEILGIAIQLLQSLSLPIFIFALINSNYYDNGPYIFTYAVLMSLAEYVWIMYLFIAGEYSIWKFNKPLLIVISGVFISIYVVLIFLQVLFILFY